MNLVSIGSDGSFFQLMPKRSLIPNSSAACLTAFNSGLTPVVRKMRVDDNNAWYARLKKSWN